MRFIRSRTSAFVLLALSAAGVPAFAGTLLQDGAAQPAVALGTYGMQTTIPVALHTILPKGWSLVIAQGVDLPGKVSWAPTDTWLDTLARIADRTEAGFLVDWNRHQLAVRSVTETSRAVATLEQARQQAVDPLPSLAPKHAGTNVPPAAAVTAAPAVAAASPPADRDHPVTVAATSPVVAPRPVAAPAPAAPVAQRTPIVAIDPTQSFASESVGKVLEVLATHYQLNLEFTGPDFPLPGPVTLRLKDDLGGDVERLQRALGPQAPLAVTTYARSHELLVERAPLSSYSALEARPQVPEHRSLFARVAGFHRAAAEPAPLAQSPTTAAIAAPVSVASGVSTTPVAPLAVEPKPQPTAVVAQQSQTPTSPSSSASVPAAVATPVALAPTGVAKVPAPALGFDIAVGERLSVSLERFLRAQGWQLEWRSPTDLQADEATHLSGPTVESVLAQILPTLGLSHSVDAAKHLIVVSPSTQAATAP